MRPQVLFAWRRPGRAGRPAEGGRAAASDRSGAGRGAAADHDRAVGVGEDPAVRAFLATATLAAGWGAR
jgi:hypothetical protein